MAIGENLFFYKRRMTRVLLIDGVFSLVKAAETILLSGKLWVIDVEDHAAHLSDGKRNNNK